MREIVTEALVLKTELSGEMGKSVVFFTAELGRLKARAVGAQKILSKFSPHLEIGSLVELRLAGNSGWTITDVLTLRPSFLRIPGADLERINSSLRLLDNLSLPSPDTELWTAVSSTPIEEFVPATFLKIFGYSTNHSTCFKCGTPNPKYFYFADHSFFCSAHAAEIPAENKIRC
jgi:recombinational DNA repair protein (RecF pathway)